MSTLGQERAKNPGGAIYIKVKCQDGNEDVVRIRRNSQLSKLMKAYCNRKSLDVNSIAFLFDGRRLGREQTPNELHMEDGDEVHALMHQTGGAGE